MSEKYKGLIASSGVAIGNLYLFTRDKVVISDNKIGENDTKEEFAKVKKAIDDYIQDLAKLEGASEAQSNIAKAHTELLSDPYFTDTIESKITNELKNSEMALDETIKEMVEIMSQIDDDYLRERASDYQDIGFQVMYKLKGITPKTLSNLDKGSIVISKELTPSDTSNMDKEAVVGFATDLGGKTSHTSIIAQTLDIPALVGMGDISKNVKGGEKAILDTNEGILIVNPSDEEISKYELLIKEQKEKKERLKEIKDKEAISTDGKKIEVSANIGNIEDLKLAIENGCDGVGLFRTEFLYMQNSDFPSEESQFEVYKEATQMLGDKPLIIRTLDIGGDKGLDYFEFPKEDNPFLGYRAIRLCLDKKEMFKDQLRGLVRASAFGNLKIMIPFVVNIDELKEARNLIEEIKEELDEKGIAYNKDLDVGIMVETSSSIIMADKFIKYADFFSIGTNDLTQYTLAVDRGNEHIADYYSNFNPAVLRAIKHVIDVSHKAGKWTGMCGAFASDTQATKLLLGLGLDEFSGSSAKIAEIKDTIITSSQEEEAKFADKVLDCELTEEVENLVKEHN
ncbi:phosphoenolpyruvate--protein phosphotransferase [Anaerococcus prevotii]|uniref:Phosphoenolpyruvate-protein phosphotransferase n=1 Tax=Anaerococcus prevotii (strain ATCC 9321 / DSM 20548 / JCM 6508 / NCTC 11806 / PC1) TaxID=525919 RepID=C7RHF0_ANAPD|nr:phosphoenolpyruvate--protein phosphotransferase [Anaerococcus prevotii]ACV28911.1 phosphoenolpyruvate-protein phosphotransferase [Anaerococcus prevotii DSM 20548]